ncbi:MFS transporter [Roseateles sp. DAIF2]|uniref:MFS transporter n=1 Tax=Roseateles sp. DAIF2 TaxID=2714952 RepID=UPI0018A24BDD|nr:MFS transporter [Roseateles sp. DAIF2]QPF74104.1 MFS transporter [Roseateles sp. DAIF2]
MSVSSGTWTAEREGLPAGLWLTLLASSCGFVVVLLDVTIVNVALPSIGAALGGGAGQVHLQQWVVDAYTLALASLMLSGGALGDRYGSRRVFEAGLALFALASAACALAPGIGALVAGRALQGLAAALLLPGSLALISHASAGDAALRARAIGLWSSVGGLVSAAGPALGGALLLRWDWPSIFWINLPICALGLFLSRRHVAETPRQSERPLDLAGNAWALLLFAALTASLLEAGARGLGDPLVLVGLALALIAGIGFWRSQRRAAAPVLPLPLLARPAISLSLALGLLTNLAFYGLIFVLSHYFQRERGYSALQAGLALLPFVVVMLGNVASGRLAARRGALWPVRLGLALTAAGYLYAAALLLWLPQPPYLWLLPALLLMPFGGGLTIPALTSHLLGQADAGRYGAVSAVFNTARQLGAALGVATLGALMAGAGRGAGTAFAYATLLLLACLVLSRGLGGAR